MFVSPPDCEILKGGRHGIFMYIPIPDSECLLEYQPNKHWWNPISSLLRMGTGNLIFANVFWREQHLNRHNKDVCSVNFSFCQGLLVKILVILTLDWKYELKNGTILTVICRFQMSEGNIIMTFSVLVWTLWSERQVENNFFSLTDFSK